MNEIFLKFENESFSLFVSPTNENILFGKDYEPVAIDIPLENGETYAEVLYNSPIYFLILELKEILKIEHVDVHVDMPLLEIDFDQESAVLKQKSLAEFVRFHESLSLYHDIPVSSFEFLLKKVSPYPNY